MDNLPFEEEDSMQCDYSNIIRDTGPVDSSGIPSRADSSTASPFHCHSETNDPDEMVSAKNSLATSRESSIPPEEFKVDLLTVKHKKSINLSESCPKQQRNGDQSVGLHFKNEKVGDDIKDSEILRTEKVNTSEANFNSCPKLETKLTENNSDVSNSTSEISNISCQSPKVLKCELQDLPENSLGSSLVEKVVGHSQQTTEVMQTALAHSPLAHPISSDKNDNPRQSSSNECGSNSNTPPKSNVKSPNTITNTKSFQKLSSKSPEENQSHLPLQDSSYKESIQTTEIKADEEKSVPFADKLSSSGRESKLQMSIKHPIASMLSDCSPKESNVTETDFSKAEQLFAENKSASVDPFYLNTEDVQHRSKPNVALYNAQPTMGIMHSALPGNAPQKPKHSIESMLSSSYKPSSEKVQPGLDVGQLNMVAPFIPVISREPTQQQNRPSLQDPPTSQQQLPLHNDPKNYTPILPNKRAMDNEHYTVKSDDTAEKRPKNCDVSNPTEIEKSAIRHNSPVSSSIVEPLKMVRGNGNSAESTSANEGLREIEEPILIVRGRGSGMDCNVGNPRVENGRHKQTNGYSAKRGRGRPRGRGRGLSSGGSSSL